ncbi:hypothetical protein L7F22_057273 [Adiantum nelumboides]|nr:hypothetical protein [Adiantum nelumboides]
MINFKGKFKAEEGHKLELQLMPKEAYEVATDVEVREANARLGLRRYYEQEPCGIDFQRAYELMSSIKEDGHAMITDPQGEKIEVVITKDIVVEVLKLPTEGINMRAKDRKVEGTFKKDTAAATFNDINLKQLEVPLPSPSSSTFEKSYDITKLESGDLELHKLEKIKEAPSQIKQLHPEELKELPSMEVNKEKEGEDVETVPPIEILKDDDMTPKEIVQEKQGELAKSPKKELATKEKKIEATKSPQKETTTEKKLLIEQSQQAAASIEELFQQPQEWTSDGELLDQVNECAQGSHQEDENGSC